MEWQREDVIASLPSTWADIERFSREADERHLSGGPADAIEEIYRQATLDQWCDVIGRTRMLW